MTPLADRVDTTDAALEFPTEAESEAFLPERPMPCLHVAPAASASPPRSLVPRSAAPALYGARRLLWLVLAVAVCAPIVSIALREVDRTVPPQTAIRPSPPARAPKDQFILAASTPPGAPLDRVVASLPAKKATESPRKRQPRRMASRRTGSRESSPALAPAAAPAVFYGALHVVSEPSGARVFVNGRSVGSTPLVLQELSVGSRVVRVEADGHQPWSSAIRVVANQQTRVAATLRR